ncbi:MAG: CDP-diacylglycerol--serine O-phosphatidyltransferase [Gammaproteobacteria bacterium]
MTDDHSEEKQPHVKKRRKGIYLLPNLFTTAGLFSGFYAIVAAMSGHYEAAAVAIFIAMIMDGIDGRVARLTNTQSDFGVEYDSLSDMVGFGLAPSLVIFAWSIGGVMDKSWIWYRIAWLAAFMYTAGAALRLARFNTHVGDADKRYFIGLPSPSAAAVLAGFVWFCADQQIRGEDVWLFAAFLSAVMGGLMVSNFRYYSFKEVDFRNKVPFVAVLVVVMSFVVISSDPPSVLFMLFIAYALSGPVTAMYRYYLRWRR